MKQLVLVHGWGGNPENCWFPWIKHIARDQGFCIVAPQMPYPDQPVMDQWIDALFQHVPHPDTETFFIGHSLGTQTILRYLERLPANAKVGGVILVAGFVTLFMKEIEAQGATELARPWLETPLNWNKIRSHCTQFGAIFSDDDYYVPIENVETLKENIHAKTLILHRRGHLNHLGAFPELKEMFLEMIDQ